MDENKNQPQPRNEAVEDANEQVEVEIVANPHEAKAPETPETEAAVASEIVVQTGPKPGRRPGAPWPWIAVALLAVAALVFVLVRDSMEVVGGGKNEVVGRMDGAAITKADLYDELTKQLGKEQVAAQLDNLMLLNLLNLEAASQGITASAEDVDAEINDFKKQFGSDDDFQSMLQQYNMTLDGLKEEVEISVKLRKIFEPQINPSEDDLKNSYEENIANYESSPEQVRASHILLSTKEEAVAVLAELKQGADFAAIAKAKSIDEASKENGGDLDFFARGEMDEAFETASFELDKGQLSDVVESPYGFHIIQVTDKKDAVTASYEEVKRQVKNAYLDQEIDNKIGDWITEKKKAYHYENLLTPPSEGSDLQ